MARIRNIKPETFDDPDLCACSPLARWVFIGLWTQADRDGRLEDDPRRLKARLLPYDTGNFPALLDELAPRFITRYTVDGKNYIQVNDFTQYQRFHKDEKSGCLPAPAGKFPLQPGNFPAKSPESGSLETETETETETESAPADPPAPASAPTTASANRPTRFQPKPLSYRSRIDVAWPGRPPVPGPLHAEFRERLAGDPAESESRLRAWYPTAADAYADQDIGDDPWKFWNARFREWVGTTVRAVSSIAAEPELDNERMIANLRKRGVV